MIVVALPPTGFPSLPHLRACALPTRFAGPLQLTRPDGLVVCRYGLLDDTPPPPCERPESLCSLLGFPPPQDANLLLLVVHRYATASHT
eukprot:COSAG01_NODE_8682_length_2697_cov_23.461124_5_plen_89_part_00